MILLRNRYSKFLYSTALQRTRTFICCLVFWLYYKCTWLQ